jgi:NAD(P)-dependent dehydrogenase (short-subunit alcohol dehydrogenase family)
MTSASPPPSQRPLSRRLRALFAAAPCAEPVDLRGRNIIVTGASPGSIGFETARILADWGASITVTTRSNPQALRDALLARMAGTHPQVTAQALDLCRADSVARFVDWYRATQGMRLDALINNAGVHLDLLSQWKEPQLSADGFEIHWRTNYLGTSHLTHLLLPLLREAAQQSGEARAVNVVSMLHRKGSNAGLFEGPRPYNSWVAYGLSKLALVHATFEMQRRFAGSSKVQAYCLHPGAVFTNIAGKGLAGNRMIEAVRNALAPVEGFFLLTPEEGAQTQIHCATHPGLAGGLYYDQCRPKAASAEAEDARVAARLFDETETWVKSLG